MHDTTRTINPNFTFNENAKLKSLMKFEPEHDYVDLDFKRTRPSKLDPHLTEILKKKDEGWSYQRIADFLKTKHKIESVWASTVLRRINEFYKNG